MPSADLYTDCELDDDGASGSAWCLRSSWPQHLQRRRRVIAQVAEFLARPIVEAIAMVKAIVDAGHFFGSGTAPRHVQPATRNRLPRGLMSTGQLAAFAVLVGTYCLASVLAGFWLAWRNRR